MLLESLSSSDFLEQFTLDVRVQITEAMTFHTFSSSAVIAHQVARNAPITPRALVVRHML